uniref:Uncharacterized protein n=1 Tax=Anguilla anguilla TaxID=7936 RepID=A0A0E9R400_ANGAN
MMVAASSIMVRRLIVTQAACSIPW